MPYWSFTAWLQAATVFIATSLPWPFFSTSSPPSSLFMSLSNATRFLTNPYSLSSLTAFYNLSRGTKATSKLSLPRKDLWRFLMVMIECLDFSKELVFFVWNGFDNFTRIPFRVESPLSSRLLLKNSGPTRSGYSIVSWFNDWVS